MKIKIEATQRELNSKRLLLAKKFIPYDHEVVLKADQIKFDAPERATNNLKAEKEMLSFYDAEFKKMLKAIKEDIDAII